MAKIIELWPGRDPKAMSGRGFLAMLIEVEKAYRVARKRYGVIHQRDIPIPLELAESLLDVLDYYEIR